MRNTFFNFIFKFLPCLFVLFFSIANAQTAFFKSEISISDKQLREFYSSVSCDGNQVYFLANNYTLYCFDKKSGTSIWQNYLGNKSNNSPKVNENSVFVTKKFDDNAVQTIQINAKTGDTIQSLNMYNISSEPFFRNNMMYCTAIEDGGKIIAYDLKTNKTVWSYFIGHGMSTQPYYLKDKIIVGMEDQNWFEIDYNGKFLDTICDYKASIGTVEFCTKQFKALNFKQKEIKNKDLEEENGTIKIKYTNDCSIAMTNYKLFFLNGNNKTDHILDLNTIKPEEEIVADNNYFELLKAEDATVSFFYQNVFVIYNHKKKTVLKKIDLTTWQPHQIVLDNNTLWIISSTDRQLYGVNF